METANRKLRARPCRKGALTLVELLVVMAIMTIIVSAIVTASLAVMGNTQVKATEALLGKLAQGLEQYRMEHRMYVPSDDDWSSYPVWQALEYEGKYVEIAERYKQEGDTFQEPETGARVRRYFYVDAWRQGISYHCEPPYSRFTLRSRGPNLEFGKGDDITFE